MPKGDELLEFVKTLRKKPPKIEAGKVGALRRLAAQEYPKYGPGYQAVAKSDSIEAGLLNKPSTERMPAYYLSQREHDRLLRRKAAGTITEKEEEALTNYNKVFKGIKSGEEESQVLKDLLTAEKEMGETKEEMGPDHILQDVPFYSEDTRQILEKRKKEKTLKILMFDLSKTVSNNVGKKINAKQAEQNLASAMAEVNELRRKFRSGEIRATEGKLPRMLNEIAHKYGFDNFDQLYQYAQKAREYAD